MKRIVGLALLLLALIVTTETIGFCAVAKKTTAKKPATKTTAKKPAAKTTHYVKGTTQLKGEYAEFGTTYTLGKDYPLNITLKSAEYSVEPVSVGKHTYVPNAEEKLLILHMTYHNPQPRENFVRWDTLAFTVVDPQSQNHDGLKDLGMEKDKLSCSMNMKPAQKIEVYGVIVVPADGEMPKLIIKSSDELVLRYNLKDKVKGLPALFADSSDNSGATALTKINAQIGTPYSLGEFSLKVNNFEFSSSTKMGENEVDEGEKFLVVQMDVKNVTADEKFMRWDTFDSKVIDVDDVEVANGCTDMFQKSKDKSFSMNIQPGQEVQVRCIFKIPDDTELKTFSTRLNEGRTFIYDISSVN
jgi:hypothetical protein